MSGRRLGRLFGSLLVLSAVAAAVLGGDVSSLGELRLADVIWA